MAIILTVMGLKEHFPAQERFTLFPGNPVYDPDFWDTPLLRCYGYALQDKRLGDCVPGALSCCVEGNVPEAWFSNVQLGRMLFWDGLIEVDFSQGRSTGHIIAMTYGLKASYGSPDYHFYLYHPSQGFWSHKLGCSRPVNTDSEGKIITDPRFAARELLEGFVGYFTLPWEGVPAFPRIDGEGRAEQQTLAQTGEGGYNPRPCPQRL